MADHFSEDDAQRIFARAAERQGTGDAPPDGLSLDELKAIGQASGIDPAHIAAAAAELRVGAEPVRSGGFLGLPAPIRETRVLPVALSDEAWESVVEDLRGTFGLSGVASEIGRTREWTAGRLSGRDGVRVTARARSDGRTQLDATYSLETNVQALRLVTGVFAVLVAVLTVVGVLADKPGAWLFGLVVGLLLAISVGIPVWMLRRQARAAERAFGPLLDRAELAARDTAEAPREADASARVDLPDDDLPDPHPPRRRRRRTR